jgi:hypothetical protein
MISIAEMKTIAEKEREVEKQAKKVKYEKDLAMYRDRLKEVKPKLIKGLENRIYTGLKNNHNNIGLYKSAFEDLFKPINKYGTSILVYLVKPEYEANDAYTTALKELAEEVRKELFGAGVKRIKKNSHSCFAGEPYLYLEV